MTKLAALSLPVLLALPVGFASELSSLTRSGAEPVPEPVLAEEPERSIAAPEAPRTPLPLVLPHAERLVLDGTGDPFIAAFETTLSPPEVLHVVTSAGEGARGALAVDVLQPRGVLDVARLATFGGEAGPVDARWTPPVTGTYVVRVRALPGSAGAFGVALDRRAPLAFPVATDAADPVRSFFGDVRDGGRRDHHGIDIFAPRGTPVVAAASGLVARVGTSSRGGLHVWQRAVDENGRRIGSLYYAHLDTASVTPGTRVARGDVLGTVGNTGNARTTPPHLHFGLYRRFRGPADPLPLVGRVRTPPVEVGHGHALAPWLAVTAPALNLRAGPGTSFGVVARLAGGALVEVLGVVEGSPGGGWVRVRAADEGGAGGGTLDGFVARNLLAPGELAPLVLDAPASLLLAPRADAPRLAALEVGTALTTSGAFGSYRHVVTDGGARGWLGVEPLADVTDDAALSDG